MSRVKKIPTGCALAGLATTAGGIAMFSVAAALIVVGLILLAVSGSIAWFVGGER